MVLHIDMECYPDNVIQVNDCGCYIMLYTVKMPCPELSLQTCTESSCFIFIGY